MIKRVKQLFLTDLVKISSWSSIATAVRIATQFVISKILALFVGPSGLAILGQLTNIGSVVQAVGSGGITIGVTKYIAEHGNNKAEQQKIIDQAFKVVAFCSLACTFILVLSYQYIGRSFFKTDAYNSVILVLGATLILFSFNTLFLAIINGLRQFRLYVIINVVTSIVNLLLTLFFVKQWNVYGALLSFVLSPALIFFVSYFLVYRQSWLNFRFFSVKTDRTILRKFGQFSLMAINNAVVGAMAQIVIRSLISKKLSLDVAGIWDGLNRLSGAYLLLLTTSIQVYYLPTLAAITEPKLVWKEIMKTEKIILPLVLVMCIFIYLFRGLVVNVLFTNEFYLMKDLFIYQLTGDLIKVASWILSYTMYAKAMTKQLIITDNIFTVVFISLTYLLIGTFGIHAVYYAYIINNLIYLIFIYFFLKRTILSVRL